MASEVENMFYVRETPWHGLGTRVEEAVSSKEAIEKRKKALITEKDLYDYQRKVAGQTKTIASIQKQIAALTGDKSEEARAKLQKLNTELGEAQQDLKDTEYDKWISD